MKNLIMSLCLALMTTVSYAKVETLYIETIEVENFDSQAAIEGDAGEVIAIAKEIVALGEQVYTLVQKGKPSNTTSFTPINIVPKDPISKEIVDPLDMENCSFPVQKKFATKMMTGGVEVVRFEYMVLYTYNCSYNGTGKYIQNAIVQPVSVKTGYGWDFNASMKLQGITNHGTKAQPVVGAILTIKYSMNSWRMAFERNDTVHISGNGELKIFSN